MTIPDDLSDCDANDGAAIELIDSNGDGPIRAEARENEGGERVRAATFLHAIYVYVYIGSRLHRRRRRRPRV